MLYEVRNTTVKNFLLGARMSSRRSSLTTPYRLLRGHVVFTLRAILKQIDVIAEGGTESIFDEPEIAAL